MSIRSYRVIEIKHEQNQSFNLWHDEKLMDFLDREAGFSNNLSDDATGLASVPLEALEKVITMAEKLELDVDTIQHLKNDIESARTAGDEWVEYYCY